MNAVLRKLNTFRHHPILSLRSKEHQAIDQMVTRWGRHHLERAGVMPSIHEFRAARPAHAFPPQYGDLWFLYKMVRARRPGIVWEFGSGNSTVVLTKALFDNGAGHLYSMDAEAE